MGFIFSTFVSMFSYLDSKFKRSYFYQIKLSIKINIGNNQGFTSLMGYSEI